jgi:pyruvate/2-oxoglutarate dehydrogenase complex dihydrolipoamide dehydrogenase (E3) component
MVVGGGPAGMWAAKIAALRGHDVVLYEKGDELGGQVLLAMKGAGREEFGAIIRNERQELQRLEVPVILETCVTADQVRSEDPDAVVLATGSHPKACPVAGCDGPAVFNVWQVLRGEADLGQRVLMLDSDGHHQGTATAEHLADLGKTVHIVTPSLFAGSELGPTQDLYLTRQRLLTKGVTFTPDFAVMEVKGTAATGFNVYSNEWATIDGYDSIVTAMGNDVDDELYFALKGPSRELYRIGDCVAPRRVDMAIYEGYTIGRRL